MEAAGDLYLDRYEGWYSVRDEAFYDEKRADRRGRGREAVAAGHAGRMDRRGNLVLPPVQISASRLLELYRGQPDFIQPESRRNEVMRFVEGGLKDLSVSRTSFDWGVPVPGSPDHVMYVWVDALTTYMTGVGFPDRAGDCARFWPADVHLIGKDIVRFHAVYWPAFLMSRRAAAAQAGVRPRLPARPRREDVEEPRQCRRPDGAGRALRGRRAALFPAARSQLRPGRQLQRRSDRHPRQCRARQQLRQSRPAQLVDDLQEFGRRHSRAGRGEPRTARCSPRSTQACAALAERIRALRLLRRARGLDGARCSPATPMSTRRRPGRCARPTPSAWPQCSARSSSPIRAAGRRDRAGHPRLGRAAARR